MPRKSKQTWPTCYVPFDSPPEIRRRVRFIRASAPVRQTGLEDYVEEMEWWIARSAKSAAQLLQAFANGDVACVMYERTGAIVEIDRDGAEHLIGIQLMPDAADDGMLDVSLSEAGVFLEEIWKKD